MPTLLQDAVADLSLWSVGQWKTGKFVQTAPLLYKDVQDLIQLIPSSEVEECYTACAPNVFTGSGEEDRKGIMFNVSDSARVSLELLEDCVRELLKKDYPKIADWRHSSCKPPAQYSGSIKGKIKLSSCKFFDADGKPVEAPEEWKGLTCVPVVQPSVYLQKNSAGLILEVVGLKLGERKTVTPDIQVDFV